MTTECTETDFPTQKQSQEVKSVWYGLGVHQKKDEGFVFMMEGLMNDPLLLNDIWLCCIYKTGLQGEI